MTRPKQRVVEDMAPVLTMLFAPLFAVMRAGAASRTVDEPTARLDQANAVGVAALFAALRARSGRP